MSGTPSRLLHEAYKTKSAVLEVLRDPVANLNSMIATEVLGAPIHILSYVQAEQAAGLARRLLAFKAPDEVRAQAVLALAESTNDASLQALIDQVKSNLKHHAMAQNAAVRALSRGCHPKTEDRLLDLLTPKLPETTSDRIVYALVLRRSRRVLPVLKKTMKGGGAAATDAASSILRLATDDEMKAATGLSSAEFFRKNAPDGWINGRATDIAKWARAVLAAGEPEPVKIPSSKKASRSV